MATTNSSKTEAAVLDPRDSVIRIRLPKEYADQEDKVVNVNEVRYVIKRGVNVDVPRSVYEVLQNEQRLEEKSMRFCEGIGKGEH